MKIGSPLWKLKMRMRRQPWLVFAPLLLLLTVLLGSCATRAVQTLSIAASLLWLAVGLAVGFGIGKLVGAMGSKPPKSSGRRPRGRWR
ncbi:hypothetical protein [Tumebacillus permanentifrigoris]|uniref:Uncharacterized protein n=1 Tax=Tumebacillus permanentifrigoris TaxID=378543 RepID=A0A316D933_9BACL|nr:hypothetical protein [Tumebacillus permanentifrigoris]PWK12738.1 hypothetical protein C7459_10990 [Tumebacillus permanentifrigoris]